MAVLRHGILGGVTNKVGGVVGYNSRGQDIVRAYAVPSNPRSPGQQMQRFYFRDVCSSLALVWNDDIKRVWDVMQSGKPVTGWSRAVQYNMDMMAGTFMWDGLRPVNGPRRSFRAYQAVYTGPSPSCTLDLNWDDLNIGYPTSDLVGAALVVDILVKRCWFVKFADFENTNGTTLSLPAGTIKSSLFCYMWCANASHSITSPSTTVVIT